MDDLKLFLVFPVSRYSLEIGCKRLFKSPAMKALHEWALWKLKDDEEHLQ
jgi:hypothetical protein